MCFGGAPDAPDALLPSFFRTNAAQSLRSPRNMMTPAPSQKGVQAPQVEQRAGGPVDTKNDDQALSEPGPGPGRIGRAKDARSGILGKGASWRPLDTKLLCTDLSPVKNKGNPAPLGSRPGGRGRRFLFTYSYSVRIYVYVYAIHIYGAALTSPPPPPPNG